MKIALLSLFFLLLTSTNASEYVYDTKGEPISEAYSYTISIGTALGQPYFTLPNDGSCPLSVIAAAISYDNPVPLPVKVKNNLRFPYPYAFTGMPLNFTFVDKCDNKAQWFAKLRFGSNAWSLLFGDDVESLSVKGNFIVKDYGEKYSYKIIFCPKDSQNPCRDLALRDNRYLDIVDGNVTPLEIRFKKVNSGISMVV